MLNATTTNTGEKLTDDEIVAHATNFLFAGYETSGSTLSFISYLLALNPDVQEKLQVDIDTYFQENPVRTSLQILEFFLLTYSTTIACL